MKDEQLARATQIKERQEKLSAALDDANPVIAGGKNDLTALSDVIGWNVVRNLLQKIGYEELERLEKEFADL